MVGVQVHLWPLVLLLLHCLLQLLLNMLWRALGLCRALLLLLGGRECSLLPLELSQPPIPDILLLLLLLLLQGPLLLLLLLLLILSCKDTTMPGCCSIPAK
jgi:hypothetical protein